MTKTPKEKGVEPQLREGMFDSRGGVGWWKSYIG